MKRVLLILLMSFGIMGIVNAQQNKTPSPDEITKKSVEELEKRLKLNATQKSVIYSFTLNQVKQQAELIKKQQTGGFKEDDVDKYYRIQNDANNNIRNVLKGEQQTEFDKYIEERLSGINKNTKKKKKKGEEEEVPSDIKGLLSVPKNEKENN